MSDAAFFLFLLSLIVLCAGDPDILDGLAKRANNTCITSASESASRNDSVQTPHSVVQEEVELSEKPDPLSTDRADVPVGEAAGNK